MVLLCETGLIYFKLVIIIFWTNLDQLHYGNTNFTGAWLKKKIWM